MKKVTLALAVIALAGCQNSPVVEATPTPSETSTADTPVADDKTATSEANYADQGKQIAWIERGKETIKAKLRDPDSAKFRNVEFHSGGGVPVACGEVNANNGFGGKAGFERFLAAGSNLAVLESEMKSSADFDEVASRFCRG